MLHQKELYIFDFDGTIANSVPAALQILQDLGDEYRLPTVYPELVSELKHKSVKELMHMAGLTWIQVPGFLKKARIRFRHMIHEVEPFEGLPEIICRMKEQHHRLGILTSNREDNVRDFLQRHDLELFDFIESSTSLFGKSRKLNRIVKHTGVFPHDMVMIGDEVRDINAAKKVGVSSVAVTWGFNSPRLLKTSNPDFIVGSPGELDQLLCSPSSSGNT